MMMRRRLLLLPVLLLAGCSFDLVDAAIGGRAILDVQWEFRDQSADLNVAFQPGTDPTVQRDDLLEVDGNVVSPTAAPLDGSFRYHLGARDATVRLRSPAINGSEFRPLVEVEPLRLLLPDTIRIGPAGATIAIDGVTQRSGGPGVSVEGFNTDRVSVNTRVDLTSGTGPVLAGITGTILTQGLFIPSGLLPPTVRSGLAHIRLIVGQTSDATLGSYRLQVTRAVFVSRPFVVVD